MNPSRQLLLGTGVFLGGGMLLYAMVQQSTEPVSQNPDTSVAYSEVTPQAQDNNMIEPLTADIETEERILAQKKREREQKVAELDRRAKEFLKEQERAEALAMEKARQENQQYRDNAIEPTNEVDLADTDLQAQNINNDGLSNDGQSNGTTTIAKPVIEARESAIDQTQPAVTASASTSQAPSSPQRYIVKRGDGFIKIAKMNNVPLEALLEANKLTANSTIHVGEQLTIPARAQINTLVQAYNKKVSQKQSTANTSQPETKTQQSNVKTDTKKDAPSSNTPTRPTRYQVKRGDGLIKLAREYDVPVEALAEANNMTTNTTLRLGQTLTIPSRRQVARLQREAAAKQKALADKKEAQRRLAEARRKAASGEAKGTFGVQVTLADNQAKADEVVKKLRAAGYSASTSATSRGVRVIIGPEKGKEAALALKDKINADPKVDVNNAWVLYWR